MRYFSSKKREMQYNSAKCIPRRDQAAHGRAGRRPREGPIAAGTGEIRAFHDDIQLFAGNNGFIPRFLLW